MTKSEKKKFTFMNFKKENQNIDDKINEKNNNKLFFHLL
jgi:hypothetical protein